MPNHKYPDIEVPKSLQRKGLQGYNSNLKEGESVQLPIAHMMLIFGDDIREHFAKKRKREQEASGNAVPD
ncbi:MAG: hypothetical protein HUJ30_00670 [Gammaproteobacteria bacterium]|nr:hypothetical protein [Gammaproteobacteria bacterium]